MHIYSIHIRRQDSHLDPDFALVKEGFSCPAFLFNIFWALWHRLWVVATALLTVSLIITVIFEAIDLGSSVRTVLSVGWSVIIGMLANDVRRPFLKRDGYVEDGVALGKNSDEALNGYLRDTDARLFTPAGRVP